MPSWVAKSNQHYQIQTCTGRVSIQCHKWLNIVLVQGVEEKIIQATKVWISNSTEYSDYLQTTLNLVATLRLKDIENFYAWYEREKNLRHFSRKGQLLIPREIFIENQSWIQMEINVGRTKSWHWHRYSRIKKPKNSTKEIFFHYFFGTRVVELNELEEYSHLCSIIRIG